MRKVLFWLHLTAGAVAGLAILVMCLTGVMLTFERQVVDWADRGDARVTPPPGAIRLSLSELIARSGGMPAGIIVHSDPREPVEVAMGRDRLNYVNPYTGAVTGQPSKHVHQFFENVRAWHRWVALGEPARKTTEPIYDAANVIFLFIVISGPFLWWPKKLTWKHFRPIVWFRGGLSGKARDFNWHNAIGLWTSLPLLIIVLSGVVLSYGWATQLVYRLAGTQQPNFNPPKVKAEKLPAWQGVDGWLAHAESRLPDWRTISVRNVPSRTVTLSVDSGTGGQPQKRYNLTLDRVSGAEVKWEPFTQNNLGFELRLLARFAHTGEVGGWPVQAFAGLCSLGGAFLVYTGIALSLRSFAAWRRRRSRTAVVEADKVGSF